MGLILLIYTTPERLLNALALRGYFREAASKNGSGRSRKDEKLRAAANQEHKSPGPKPLRSASSRIATAYSGCLRKMRLRSNDHFVQPIKTCEFLICFAHFRRSNILPLTA